MNFSRDTEVDHAALLQLLDDGDRRTIGHVPEVIRAVERAPHLFPSLLDALRAPDPRVCMRAADAAEKLTRAHPEWLQPHASSIRALAAEAQQQEVRWHLAPMIPRIAWADEVREELAGVLEHYLEDDSRIVQAEALGALVALAEEDGRLRERVQAHVQRLCTEGAPAVRVRARKLLSRPGV